MLEKQGVLTVVGVGMVLGAQITPIAQSYIEQADVVFASMSHGMVEKWVMGMNGDVRNLQQYYAEGKDRTHTYAEMVNAILAEVRAGKQVCAAFYGHPGVFAWAPHEVIRIARAEGFRAQMEPGISAEDCLYADLGIDPGDLGCQHYGASQLMYFKKRIDASSYLVVWQPAMAGDLSLGRFTADPAYLQLLVERLAEVYPLSHQVILYEAATLPFDSHRADRVLLSELAQAELKMHTTLVIPPSVRAEPDSDMVARLRALSAS